MEGKGPLFVSVLLCVCYLMKLAICCPVLCMVHSVLINDFKLCHHYGNSSWPLLGGVSNSVLYGRVPLDRPRARPRGASLAGSVAGRQRSSLRSSVS